MLLVLAFGIGFVALGVGSGNSNGLFDAVSSAFGGGGTSISKLEKKVDKHPKDTKALRELGQAYAGKSRWQDAISTYDRYLAVRPRDVEILGALSIAYQQRIAQLQAEGSNAIAAASVVASRSAFIPGGSSKLGKAFATFGDPFVDAQAGNVDSVRTQYITQIQAAQRGQLDAVKRIADASPDDSSALFQVAQTAEAICSTATLGVCPEAQDAIDAYRKFVKEFPDDSLVSAAKQRIKLLQQYLATTTGNSGATAR